MLWTSQKTSSFRWILNLTQRLLDLRFNKGLHTSFKWWFAKFGFLFLKNLNTILSDFCLILIGEWIFFVLNSWFLFMKLWSELSNTGLFFFIWILYCFEHLFFFICRYFKCVFDLILLLLDSIDYWFFCNGCFSKKFLFIWE